MKTRILWLCQSASEFGEMSVDLQRIVRSLHEKGIHSTLLYENIHHTDHHFLKTFDAAFPNMHIAQQIADIRPDLIYSTYQTEARFFSIPVLPFHPTGTIKEILKRKEKNNGENSNDPVYPWQLTVIIRTKNSASILEQTLKALFSQNISQYNIVVVDSESRDRTLEIVQSYGISKIWKISKNDYFPGKILNQIIEQIQSEILIFLNSDAVLLTPLALQHLLAPFHRKTIGSFARQIPRPDADPWVLRDYANTYPPIKPAPIWLPFSLCFAAMNKKVWKEHPFYTDAWGSEDIEWAVWAKKTGYQIEYVPEAIILHSHNYTCKQLYGRRFIEGEADAFIYNRSKSLSQTFFSFIKSIIKDFVFYIKKRKFKLMHQIIPIRFVYHWSYYRGNRWGQWRKINKSANAEAGQKEVLSRYDES